LTEVLLGTTKTYLFGEYLILGLSKKWLVVNNGNLLEFDAKLVGSKLVLSANLPQQDRIKKGDTHVM